MSGAVAAAGFRVTGCAVWLCAAGRMLASRHRSPAPRTTANDGRECVDIQFAAHWILGGIACLMPFPHEVRSGSNFVAGARLVVGGGRKEVTCVYGTRDQWGHWPVVWSCACMARHGFADGGIAGAFVIDGEGISGREGRSGAAFGGSEEAAGEPGTAGVRAGAGTEDQQRKDRVADQGRRGLAECVQGAGGRCFEEQQSVFPANRAGKPETISERGEGRPGCAAEGGC